MVKKFSKVIALIALILPLNLLMPIAQLNADEIIYNIDYEDNSQSQENETLLEEDSQSNQATSDDQQQDLTNDQQGEVINQPEDDANEKSTDDQDYELNIVDVNSTYSTYEQSNDVRFNNVGEAKAQAGLKQILITKDQQPLTRTLTDFDVKEGRIISANDGLIQTMGGSNCINSIYTSLGDAVNNQNPLPISGAGFDGLYLNTHELNGQYYAEFYMGGIKAFASLEHVQIIPNNFIKAQSKYVNENGNWMLYEAVDPLVSDQYSVYNLGAAPSWAQSGVNYTLAQNDQYINLADKQMSGYSFNYFQNLPGRATSNYQAQDFQSYLQYKGRSNSQYYHATSGFIEAQNARGVNSLLLFAMANHESAYGTSYFARSCNNFYGRGAYDSNPEQACSVVSFSNPYDGVIAQSYFLSNDFFDATDWRYNGSHPGNKSSGMNVKYASDPNWGTKLASHMQSVDAYLGSKENNLYSLAYVSAGAGVYQDAALNNPQYITANNLRPAHYQVSSKTNPGVSIPVIVSGYINGSYKMQLDTTKNLGGSGNYYATIASRGSYPNYEGQSSYGGWVDANHCSFPIAYTNHPKQVGYISSVSISVINHHNYKQPGQVEDNPVIGNNASSKLVYATAANQWSDLATNNMQSGDFNPSLPIQKFSADLKISNVGLEGQIHQQYKGWQAAFGENETVGNDGYNIEAMQLRLNGANRNYYSIYYRTYVANIGWLGWAKDGQIAGSVGQGLAILGMQIYVCSKNEQPIDYDANQISYKQDYFYHQAHIAKRGWQKPLYNDYQYNQSNNIEALRIFKPSNVSGDVIVNANANYKWYSAKDGLMAGTTAQGLSLNAIKIQLTGDLATKYKAYYKVYLDGYGWTNWTFDNQVAGIENPTYNITDYVIDIRPINQGAPSGVGDANIGNQIRYQSHVQYKDWQSLQYSPNMVGTTGQELRLEALCIALPDNLKGRIKYQAHVQYQGWQNPVYDGNIAGTTGKELRMEAIKISLEGSVANEYDVLYRAHVQYKGWMPYVKNGDISGTTGQSLRLEALQIKFVKKQKAYNQEVILNEQQ